MLMSAIAERIFNLTFRRKGFPWAFALVLLGSLIYALCQYGLASDLLTQLPARESAGLIFTAFFAKALQFVWVGFVFMIVAGYDSEPFRAVGSGYVIALIAFAVALPLCFALAPQVLPRTSEAPLSTDIQQAIVRLTQSTTYFVFRIVGFLCFVAQVWFSRTGLVIAGAQPANARYAALVVIGIYVFLNAIGLERIDIPPPMPSQGE
jgi:hypothetical protein